MQREITKPKDFRNQKFRLSVFKYHGTCGTLAWYFLGAAPKLQLFQVKEGGDAAPGKYHSKYQMYHSTITSDGVKGTRGTLTWYFGIVPADPVGP